MSKRNVAATFLFFAIAILSSIALGAQTSCQDIFAGGQAPIITNQNLTAKYRELCNTAYAVGHSGLTRTPLWSAEHLTRQGLMMGRGIKRVNDFRPDTRLPASERSELRDYGRSGYDRGHMSPNSDFPDAQTRDDSFLLSNMIPQDPDNNRGLHEAIESVVRKETKRRGELFVITGPLFQGEKLQSLKGRVVIPDGIFKCLCDQGRQDAGCYVENNAPGTQYNVASVAQVERMTGINLFPAMPASVKNRAMRLPVPKLRGER
jgi:endonuclease G